MSRVSRIRENTSETATIALEGSESTVIDMSYYAMGVLHMPAGWTAASIGFKAASTEGGTYQPLYDHEGNLVEMTVAASKSYALPAAVAGARFVKLWSQTSGSGVTQDGARTIQVDLKA